MKKNAIKVSIIIPVYNVEPYLDRCLNSVINQTLKDIEIIVVDDGSTDNSKKIIDRYGQLDERVRIVHQNNQGVSAARNIGLNMAEGEYIGFVDSDDWIDENFYEKLYFSAKKYDCDISSTNILKHKKYKKYNLLYKKELIAENTTNKIKLCEDKTQRFFYVWNKIYKNSFIKKYNIKFPIGRIYEDISFSINAIYFANKIVSVPSTKYNYFERKDSITKSKNDFEKKEKDHKIAYEELQDFAKEKNIKLPQRLNFTVSYWQSPFIKIYEGKYKKVKKLFGILTFFTKEQK